MNIEEEIATEQTVTNICDKNGYYHYYYISVLFYLTVMVIL